MTALAQLPDFGGGSFIYDAADTGSSASWVEIKSGTIPVEEWVKKEDWNINPNIEIDPTKGNVFQIQLQYLGFGGIKFYVEDRETANYELVHVIQYANTQTVPSVDNPIFRVGWAVRNKGNTSDIVLQGASGAAFIEGSVVYDGSAKGICNNNPSVGTTRLNVLALRNRISFNETANRAEIIPLLVSLATDTTKTAVFDVLLEPTVPVGEFLDWQYFDESLSLMENAINPVEITGGESIACFLVRANSSLLIDMQKNNTSTPSWCIFLYCGKSD